MTIYYNDTLHIGIKPIPFQAAFIIIIQNAYFALIICVFMLYWSTSLYDC